MILFYDRFYKFNVMVFPEGGIAFRRPRPLEEAEVRVVSVLISDIGVE